MLTFDYLCASPLSLDDPLAIDDNYHREEIVLHVCATDDNVAQRSFQTFNSAPTPEGVRTPYRTLLHASVGAFDRIPVQHLLQGRADSALPKIFEFGLCTLI